MQTSSGALAACEMARTSGQLTPSSPTLEIAVTDAPDAAAWHISPSLPEMTIAARCGTCPGRRLVRLGTELVCGHCGYTLEAAP